MTTEGIGTPAVSTQNIEQSVSERYTHAAREKIPALCCPVDYDPELLKIIPDEIIERDYGCGDPSRFVREGDTVLDLGSGGGKICYIASLIVGSRGRVIGVDANPEMLSLARKYQGVVADRIGYSNVEFRRGRIQDLALELDAVEDYLGANPVTGVESLQQLRAFEESFRSESPMIADHSIDVIVSNCVLNLVKEDERHQMLREMYRVLKRGGRIAISDIVSDEPVPDHMKRNEHLWSGCISGAFTEEGFLTALGNAGFYGSSIAKWDEKPWQTVEGIEFRSVTIVAFKGKDGPCLEGNQAVVYRGPWKSVSDDDGHTLFRGQRMAVCEKTFDIYTNPNGPYTGDVVGLQPYQSIAPEDAQEFDCRKNARRHPRETKGEDYSRTEISDSSCCGPEECC